MKLLQPIKTHVPNVKLTFLPTFGTWGSNSQVRFIFHLEVKNYLLFILIQKQNCSCLGVVEPFSPLLLQLQWRLSNTDTFIFPKRDKKVNVTFQTWRCNKSHVQTGIPRFKRDFFYGSTPRGVCMLPVLLLSWRSTFLSLPFDYYCALNTRSIVQADFDIWSVSLFGRPWHTSCSF